MIGYFGHRQAHRDAEARQLLDEAARKCNTEAWPYPIIQYLRRELDEPALLAAAAGERDKLTDVRTYLGLDYALAGRPEDAIPHLLWVQEHGNPSLSEYNFAVAELDRVRNRGSVSLRP